MNRGILCKITSKAQAAASLNHTTSLKKDFTWRYAENSRTFMGILIGILNDMGILQAFEEHGCTIWVSQLRDESSRIPLLPQGTHTQSSDIWGLFFWDSRREDVMRERDMDP